MISLMYLVSAGVILIICTAYYYLILAKQKNFLFNRIYLVVAGVFSFVITLPGFSYKPSRELISYTLDTFELKILPSTNNLQIISASYLDVLGLVYIFGLVVLLLINGIAWTKINKIIRKGNRMHLHNQSVVVNESAGDSFSFMNTIVVPHENISAFVIKHEQAHVKGLHSIDLLFAEMICLVLWFVPLIRLYKKAVLLNHEFTADHAAGSIDSRKDYCEQLLAHTLGIPGFKLGHTFYNPSLTKMRIIMLYKNPLNKLRVVAGYVLILPVIVVSIFVTSCKDEIRENIPGDTDKALIASNETMPQFPGGNESLINFLIKNITYPESAKNTGIEGKVFVQFTVSAEGKVQDVFVEKGVVAELDSEAIRVITFMPDWIPGTKNGKNVNMQMTIPIMFALK